MSEVVHTMLLPGRVMLAQVVPGADASGGEAANPAAGVVTAGAPDVASDVTPGIAPDIVAAPAELTAPPAEPGLTEQLSSLDFVHFIAQSDLVGKGLFVILVVMSLMSWYLILYKAISNARTRRRANRYLQRFWDASSLEQVERDIAVHGANHGRDPFSHLTSHAVEAQRHHARYGVTKLAEAGSNADFVTRTMRKVIDEETAKLENGLTVLASVGSTAPFVGLFGTVWGVYHALVSIGMSEGVTINRIAGPVGEALIMTGLGLAVAIPAVLAYNAFVRSNRVLLSRLDAFAHDLFAFLSTGQQVLISDGRSRNARREVAPASVAAAKPAPQAAQQPVQEAA